MEGTPAGWAGWRSGSGRRRVARDRAVGGVALVFAVIFALAFGRAALGFVLAALGFAGVVLGFAGAALGFAGATVVFATGLRRPGVAGAERALTSARAPRGRAADARPAGFDRPAAGLAVCSAPAVSADAGAARLSLRRWGRRRGSAPRTSDGRSLLKGYIMAYRTCGRSTGRLIMSSRCRS